MEEKTKIIAACVVVIAAAVIRRKRQFETEETRKKKKIQKRKLCSQKRLLTTDSGYEYATMLLNDLLVGDTASFKNFMRMSKETFQELRDKVCPLLYKQDTVMREALSPEAKLIVTLRFLATGLSYHELGYEFRMSNCAISIFVPEVLETIKEAVSEYFQVPKTQDEWIKISEEFEQNWNFPYCLGAIDGKHIAVKGKKQDKSYHTNYKGFKSIILFTVVDANYKFLYACVESNGKANDAAVFNDSSLGRAIKTNLFSFPADKELPNTDLKVPYVFVTDEAFRLTKRILVPNSDRTVVENRIYNYRLSRARRVAQNAFGILANTFEIFQKNIDLQAEKVDKIILTAIALYNFIREKDGIDNALLDEENTDAVTFTNGNWRKEVYVTGLQKDPGNQSTQISRTVRDKYTQFFNTTGSVPWQNESISKFNF